MTLEKEPFSWIKQQVILSLKQTGNQNILSIILDKICCEVLQRGRSLLGFIIDNYGLDKAISLFSGKSWDRVFESDKDIIIPKWKKYVLSQYDRNTQSSTPQDFSDQNYSTRRVLTL